MTAETLFRIASLTKPMGGALTLSLIQDGVLALTDPIARWLPEAAEPRVLVAADAQRDETVPADRPITVRHLLTATSGWGVVMAPTPLQAAMFEQEVFPGALIPPMSELMADRITGPLGTTATGFGTPHVERLATLYRPGPDGLEVLDPPDGLFARPPSFEELSSGLVSTAGDVFRFYSAMADGGAPILTTDSRALMTTDALTDRQREQGPPIIERGASWGLGTAVDIDVAGAWMAPGRWGWSGGTGTGAYVDPTRDTVAVLLTQREMTGPQDGFSEFLTAVAAPCLAQVFQEVLVEFHDGSLVFLR